MIFRCEQCGRLNRADPARTGGKCGGCGAPLRLDGHPAPISDDALTSLLKASPVPVLVDFYADWCGPCRLLSPVLAELAAELAGKLIVVKVDTERDQRHAGALNVSGIPAVFLFKEGKQVAQGTGFRPLPAWKSLVAPHL